MNQEQIEAFKQEIKDYYLIEKGILVKEDRLEKLFDAAVNDYEINSKLNIDKNS